MTDERKPVEIGCECGHRWIVAYLPMEVSLFCKVTKQACCPMCGSGSDKHYIYEPGRKADADPA